MGDIVVFAGPNGGGKSSVIGRTFLDAGQRYFNPDVATRQRVDEQPDASLEDLNSQIWYGMREALESSIAENRNFAFETTLGGSSITRILADAARHGARVRIWFVALRTADLHVERVQARVSSGGHDIAAEKIRQRYDSSRAHVRELLSEAFEVRVFDNSDPVDPSTGDRPLPRMLLHVQQRRIMFCCPETQVPDWAAALVAEARRLHEENDAALLEPLQPRAEG